MAARHLISSLAWPSYCASISYLAYPKGAGCWSSDGPEAYCFVHSDMGNKQTIFTTQQLDAYQASQYFLSLNSDATLPVYTMLEYLGSIDNPPPWAFYS